jgi:hypothetical protein
MPTRSVNGPIQPENNTGFFNKGRLSLLPRTALKYDFFGPKKLVGVCSADLSFG